MIPHGRPAVAPGEISAVLAVLVDGHLTKGPAISALEEAVGALVGKRQGVAASSGTAALALALGALGAGPGDEVVVPAYACSAVGHAVRFTGASAVLADVDDTLALSPAEARRKMGRRTRAVVVVHPFGFAADVESFEALGIAVVEDCAQSLGALREERPAGALGIAAAFSFYATKMVAAGEGGMVVAGDDGMLSRARAIRDGGNHRLAFNLRMSDLNAALALEQIRRLDHFIDRRRKIATAYDAAFGEGSITPMRAGNGQRPCFSRYVVRVPQAQPFIAGMMRRGIEAKAAIADPLVYGAIQQDFPNTARAIAERASLPIYPGLSDGQVERVIDAAREVAKEMTWRC